MKTLEYFSTTSAPLYDSSWASFFERESQNPYFKHLIDFLKREESCESSVFPSKSLIFNAFLQVPLDRVRVVIVGQDPYHGYGQAHGLSFSVTQGVVPPPSLKNIFKELKDDLHIEDPRHGCLLSWADQGVLLLNAILTVRASEPKSHHGQGWETFTDNVIQELANQDRPMVFMLWGKSAQQKCLHLLSEKKSSKHLVLQTTHPSPFSAYNGFLGSKHFSRANDFLVKNQLQPIDWSVK
ncbi:MAG: Uracil-DNA glycosylase [Chlamydiae bacterium]|nr:Uracil-DNA glycosylase [Chlamydiota bacterium]